MLRKVPVEMLSFFIVQQSIYKPFQMYFFFSFTETQICATTSREEEACQSMKQNLNSESVFVCWMLHIKQLNGEKDRKNKAVLDFILQEVMCLMMRARVWSVSNDMSCYL